LNLRPLRPEKGLFNFAYYACHVEKQGKTRKIQVFPGKNDSSIIVFFLPFSTGITAFLEK